MSKRKHHRPPGASSSRDTSTVNAPSSGRRRPPPPAPEAGDEVGRGTTLGRYVVVDKVGQGGMGSVYAAYDPELNRKVALKLWRDCGPSCWLDEIRARLLREAQALARLNHPHVATVYDVGTYGEQVFIAMEYLEGLTLRDWLAQEPRTRRQILDIFLQAGQGLEAAHSAGLVHRDFKPGNVMVRPDGRAVVLDFGLARDDQEDGGEQILRMDELEETSSIIRSPLDGSLTRTGALMGTPAYMAPEQHAGQPARAAADQFAFCSALYEALYGNLPFSSSPPGKARSWEVAEPPASARVPVRIRRILLRGLSIDPADRYPSMRTLLRQLAHDPREKRRRRLIAAAVLVVAVGGALGYARITDRRSRLCRGAEEKLAGIWDEPRRPAVEEVFRTSGLVYAADTWQATRSALDAYAAEWARMHTDACEATHLRGEQSRELLDLRMDCLGQRRQELAALLEVLEDGEILRFDQALQAVGKLTPLATCADTLALTAPVRPPSDAAAVERVRQVRDLLAQAKAQQSAGDYGVGLEIAHRAAAEAENIGYWPLIAEALLRRSSLEGSRARPEEVVATLHRSLEAAVAGGHERAAAETLTLLVWWVGYRQARFEQGLHYAELATAVLERLSESAQLQWKLVDYSGIIFFHQGNYEQALAHHRRALELKDQALGPDSIDAVYTLIRLGNVLITQGKPGAALAYYDRAFHITEGALGPTHPSVATALEHRGHAHRQLAQYQLARQCHERALMITEQVFGRHRRAAWILMELGTLDYLEGRFDRALERQREALKILEGTLGSENPQLASAHGAVATTLIARGEHREAIEIYRRVLAIQEKVYGREHRWVADTVVNLAGALRKLGELDDAVEHLERALRIYEHTQAADHPSIATALTSLGEALIALHQPGEAIPLLERGLEIRRAREREPALAAYTEFVLARALAAWGGAEQRALELARQALETFRKSPDRDRDNIIEVEEWLAARGRRP